MSYQDDIVLASVSQSKTPYLLDVAKHFQQQIYGIKAEVKGKYCTRIFKHKNEVIIFIEIFHLAQKSMLNVVKVLH